MKKGFGQELDVDEIGAEFYASQKVFATTAAQLRQMIEENGDRAKVDFARKRLSQCVISVFNQLRKMELEIKLVPQYSQREEYSVLKKFKKQFEELEQRL